MGSSDVHPSGTWSFEWDRGRGEVAALGGMLAPVWFRLEDGREIQPFSIAPWANEPETPNDLPGILKRLRGEWPCVPFGMPEPPAGMPRDWQATTKADTRFHSDPHGVSANHDWQLRAHFGTGVEIEFTYPESHPVEHLIRRIEGRKGQAAIDITLEIHMRRDADLPLGLHPVFALPATTGGARLDLATKFAMAYPVETEPGVSRLAPGGTSVDLRRMPAQIGDPVDITTLPLPWKTEELVQVAVETSQARLTHVDKGYAIVLDWSAKQFPYCLLWISNKGRSQPPWNNRHCALGLEPVAAAFDLGIEASCNPQNPLSGFSRTSQHLSSVKPYETRYAISVVSLAKGC